MRCADGGLVAVVHPVLIIDGENHVKDILRPAGALVGDGKCQHIGIVLGVQGRGGKPAVVRRSGALDGIVIDEDRLAHNGERIHKRYYQRSGGGGKSITVCSFIRLAFL